MDIEQTGDRGLIPGLDTPLVCGQGNPEGITCGFPRGHGPIVLDDNLDFTGPYQHGSVKENAYWNAEAIVWPPRSLAGVSSYEESMDGSDID